MLTLHPKLIFNFSRYQPKRHQKHSACFHFPFTSEQRSLSSIAALLARNTYIHASSSSSSFFPSSPEPTSSITTKKKATSSHKNMAKQSQSSKSTTKTSEKKTRSSSSSKAKAKTKTFHLFSKLPVELRALVVKEACWVPRNVPLWIKNKGRVVLDQHPNSPPRGPLRPYSYHTSSSPPKILQVNQEFRKEALRWYDLTFGIDMSVDGISYIRLPKVYINWKVDCLCLMSTAYPLFGEEFSTASFWTLCNENKLGTLAINLSGLRGANFGDWNTIASALRTKVSDRVILFNAKPRRYGAEFVFKPLQGINENGTVSQKPLSARAQRSLAIIKPFRIKFLVLWNKEERGAQNAKASISPRPKLELARYVTGRVKIKP